MKILALFWMKEHAILTEGQLWLSAVSHWSMSGAKTPHLAC